MGDARPAAATFVPGAEVDGLRWLTLPQALARHRRPRQRGRCRRFARRVPRAPTRAAGAPRQRRRRDEWAGDDDVRPLDDERARRRRERLAEVLPLCAADGGAERAAPRCRRRWRRWPSGSACAVGVDGDLAEGSAAERLPAGCSALGAAGRPGTWRAARAARSRRC